MGRREWLWFPILSIIVESIVSSKWQPVPNASWKIGSWSERRSSKLSKFPNLVAACLSRYYVRNYVREAVHVSAKQQGVIDPRAVYRTFEWNVISEQYSSAKTLGIFRSPNIRRNGQLETDSFSIFRYEYQGAGSGNVARVRGRKITFPPLSLSHFVLNCI